MSDFSKRAHASVTIERPQRYGKQLAQHLGHKIPVEYSSGSWVLTMGTGRGTVTPAEVTLEFGAEADDAETMNRIKDVLSRHLLKFGAQTRHHDRLD